MTTKKKPQPAPKPKRKKNKNPAKAAPAKAAALAKPAAKAGKAKPARNDALDELATKLGLTRAQAEERAIEALSSRGVTPKPSASKGLGPLPQRLYLLLDGRGLDGRGMGIEVIDLPTIVGSDKRCSVWVNSPQIETRHLQIWREGESWLLEDLGTAKGTYLNDLRIKRRLVQHGDEYRLAGYLRLRTEFR